MCENLGLRRELQNRPRGFHCGQRKLSFIVKERPEVTRGFASRVSDKRAHAGTTKRLCAVAELADCLFEASYVEEVTARNQ